ncbi:MAG: hypothetical protein M1828_005581 [Chrysothrix sp. TS-e1954]|nr:MAG: hypothetical protein M1828_005581 [Chrysothrix sp. TS-e1954]
MDTSLEKVPNEILEEILTMRLRQICDDPTAPQLPLGHPSNDPRVVREKVIRYCNWHTSGHSESAEFVAAKLKKAYQALCLRVQMRTQNLVDTMSILSQVNRRFYAVTKRIAFNMAKEACQEVDDEVLYFKRYFAMIFEDDQLISEDTEPVDADFDKSRRIYEVMMRLCYYLHSVQALRFKSSQIYAFLLRLKGVETSVNPNRGAIRFVGVWENAQGNINWMNPYRLKPDTRLSFVHWLLLHECGIDW